MVSRHAVPVHRMRVQSFPEQPFRVPSEAGMPFKGGDERGCLLEDVFRNVAASGSRI